MGTDEKQFDPELTAEGLLEQLNEFKHSRTLIVGIGNTLKADDAVGPLVCQKLLQSQISAEIIDAATVPENYIQQIIKKSPQKLLIVDAIDFKAAPGTIKIFKPEQLSNVAFSTHTLSPHLFIDMICKGIEVDVFVIGIQPAKIKLGEGVSEPVNEAVEQLVSTLIEVFPPR